MVEADAHLPAAGPATTGLLRAAGEGRRFGMPKALADTGGDPWVLGAARALLHGGCADVLVMTCPTSGPQTEGPTHVTHESGEGKGTVKVLGSGR